MKPHYHAIYLSPHLDDAVLSCGGRIWQQTAAKKPVLIVSITAGIPQAQQKPTSFVDKLHTRWGLTQETVTARRIEDRESSIYLGADYAHWDFLDCIYRVDAVGAPLYSSEKALFSEIKSVERPLVEQLAQQFRQLPAYDYCYVPLSIGYHVDHQLTRLAAELAFLERVRYYEDYPYARRLGALEMVLPPPQTGWQSAIISLSAEEIAHKIEAISCFASQLSTFFNGRADLENQIKGFTHQVGGERYWTKV